MVTPTQASYMSPIEYKPINYSAPIEAQAKYDPAEMIALAVTATGFIGLGIALKDTFKKRV